MATKLDKAKAQIVLDHPFFASILLKRELKEDNSIKTLAVDARGTIYYNTKFVDSLTVPQLVWGLCHEVGHVICQHATRKKHRDHKKWNYAGDAWINDMLDDCNVGTRIPNTVNIQGSKDKTSETIYDELPESDSGQGISVGTVGDGNGDWENGLGDDVKFEDLPEEVQKHIETQVKLDVAQAANAAKARGKLSGKLAEIVASIIEVKTPWYEILERYMVDYVRQEQSWLRPNRRHIGAGTYLPSMAREPSMGEVVVQVDVSGSITKSELDYYGGHLSRIVKQCNPSKVHVIYTDTEVQKHEVFEQGDEVRLEFYSGGGTDMYFGIQYCMEHDITPSVFITLTDGFTPWGDEPDFPTVWCISSNNINAPYGENVHFEME